MTSKAYEAIKSYYGDRVAERSQVPLINHIGEGLLILDALKASQNAKDAYAIHPLLQDTLCLKHFYVFGEATKLDISPEVILLAVEYRSVANSYLCKPHTDDWDFNSLCTMIPKTLVEVEDMLVADKVQNRKDFELHHKGTHARSEQLDKYFRQWLAYLGVNEKSYSQYCNYLKRNTP